MYEHMSEYVQEVRQEELEETMRVQDSILSIVKRGEKDNKD